jgi:deazaflavin-dependent oxidoreductase (nitroreductase family)
MPQAGDGRIDERVRDALEQDRTIEITTIGRRSGKPRRVEIWFHNVGGRIYISGLPGRRGWYANLLAEPEFVFHLKETVKADIRARARPLTSLSEREKVLPKLLAGIGREAALAEWVAHSPLVEVEFSDGPSQASAAQTASSSTSRSWRNAAS